VAQLKKNEERSLLHLIYYRPTHAACTTLDGKLFDLAARNRGHLKLVVRHSDEHGYLFGGWVSGTAPTVLFVRDGQMVAQLVGDLPLHEIEELLRSALAGGSVCEREQLPRLDRIAG
jgi:thioredoxin-like negative regulator of GroEL